MTDYNPIIENRLYCLKDLFPDLDHKRLARLPVDDLVSELSLLYGDAKRNEKGAAEAERAYKERKVMFQNEQLRIKDDIQFIMGAFNKHKIKTGTVTAYISEGREKIELEDESKIPLEYHKVTTTYDKAKMLDDFKTDGVVPDGVKIEKGSPTLNIRV
jgi:hypothetical protein